MEIGNKHVWDLFLKLKKPLKFGFLKSLIYEIAIITYASLLLYLESEN